MLALLIGVTGCQSETLLQFETIEQRDASGTGKEFEGRTPKIFVIANSKATSQLTGLITSEAQAKLQNLNYDDYVVVAVFQGWKGSTGYSVQIEKIAWMTNTVRVYAKLHEPRPDEAKGAMITSPYHLAQVRKIEDWQRTMLFYLIIDGVEVQNEVGVFESPVQATEPGYLIPKPGQSPLTLPMPSLIVTPAYAVPGVTKQPAYP